MHRTETIIDRRPPAPVRSQWRPRQIGEVLQREITDLRLRSAQGEHDERRIKGSTA